MQQQKSTAKTTVKANKNESINKLWKNSAEPGEPKKKCNRQKKSTKNCRSLKQMQKIDKVMINNPLKN